MKRFMGEDSNAQGVVFGVGSSFIRDVPYFLFINIWLDICVRSIFPLRKFHGVYSFKGDI